MDLAQYRNMVAWSCDSRWGTFGSPKLRWTSWPAEQVLASKQHSVQLSYVYIIYYCYYYFDLLEYLLLYICICIFGYYQICSSYITSKFQLVEIFCNFWITTNPFYTVYKQLHNLCTHQFNIPWWKQCKFIILMEYEYDVTISRLRRRLLLHITKLGTCHIWLCVVMQL